MKALSWHDVSSEEFELPHPNIIPLVWSWGMYPGGIEDSKAVYEKQPEGFKGFIDHNIYKLLGHPEDVCKDKDGNYTKFRCPWVDAGYQLALITIQDMIEFQKINGLTHWDYWLWDYETTAIGNPTHSYWICVTPGMKEAIAGDPRAESLLTRAGVKSFDHMCEFDHIDSKKLNAALSDIEVEYVVKLQNEIKKEFPGVKVSNYSYQLYNGSTVPPDHNCYVGVSAFTPDMAMLDYQSPFLYGRSTPANCHAQDGTLIQSTTYHYFIVDLNFAINSQLASDKKFHTWFGYSTFPSPIQSSPFYKETLIHGMLMNVDAVMFWNPYAPGYSNKEDQQLFSTILKEVEDHVGYKDFASLISSMIPYDAPYVESCAKANNQKVCRRTHPDGSGEWIHSPLL